MRKQTRTFSYVWTTINAMLAALTARPAAALLVNPTIRLMTSATAINQSTVIGDITEASFNGYAAITPVAHPIVTDADGTRSMMLDGTFVAGAGIVAPGQVVTGYYVTDDVASVVYGGELFEEPVPFAQVGDYLDLDVHIPVPQMADTGLPQ